ncbi:MAG: PEGA domain-containing protein [Deltaproteobacteria bacterium]|nr:PEGA domain-containing protein [Deltaproteobacteria bacterium]
MAGRRFGLGITLGTAVAVLLAASPARGQEPTDEQMETARVHFERGVELVGEEKWEEALPEFTASVEAMPTAPGLLNVGLCQRRLGRNLDAQHTFERFMSEFGSTADDVDRRDAQTQLDELRGVLGRLAVTVDEPGAELRVDDRAAGVAPLAGPVFVEPGEHTVVARLEGRDPVSRTVTVTAGQEAAVALELAAGTVAVVPPPDLPPDDGGGAADDGGVAPVWFWTAVGITGAAAIAWGITGGLALKADSDYSADPNRTEAMRDDGQALALGADICGALTGAAAAATLVLAFFVDWDDEAPDSGAAVTGFTAGPVADGLGLGVVGRF